MLRTSFSSNIFLQTLEQIYSFNFMFHLLKMKDVQLTKTTIRFLTEMKHLQQK